MKKFHYITLFMLWTSHNYELHVDYLDSRVLQMVRNDRLGVTSEGLWADPEKTPQITLSRRGDVRLVSRERSPQ